MKQLILSGTLAALATGTIIVLDQGTVPNDVKTASRETGLAVRPLVHAPGRVESTGETISIRPYFPGTIEEVLVGRGTRVKKGDPLFRYDSERYNALRDLAESELKEALAQRQRLLDGARETEIAEADHKVQAAKAQSERAEKALERANRLVAQNAISTQELEFLRATRDANPAVLDATKKRRDTISASPRESELLAADAAIESARAKLRLAEIDLNRCQISSPHDGVILEVNVHRGEWITPESDVPSVELADTENLRVVADIDELDAMRVSLGQECEVTADALPGEIHHGTVAEIEPRMNPKRIYGGWAGEREESHSRRIRIDLAPNSVLPIGLPVEVRIDRKP